MNTPSDYNANINSLVVVLGGYFIFIDNKSIWIDANNIIHLDLSQIDFLNKYIESSIYLDIEELVYTNELVYFCDEDSFDSYNNFTGYYDQEIIGDSLIINYINNTPCFLLLIDNPNVQISNYFPLDSHAPGRIELDVKPIYPLVTSTGRIIEYTYTKQHQKYELMVLDEVLKYVTFVGGNSISSNTFYSNWYTNPLNRINNTYVATTNFIKLYSQ